MLKSSLKFFGIIVVLLIVVGAFYFETSIRQIAPAFRADVILAGVLLIAGSAVAIFIRNIGIFLASLVMAFALPFLIQWFVQYWPYITSYYLK